jgi:fructose-specific phosphotransferase system IIC component
MQLGSISAVRRVLNVDLSNFSVGMNGLIQNPILTIVAFGTLQMLGRKSPYWINDEMRKWLEELGKREVVN